MSIRKVHCKTNTHLDISYYYCYTLLGFFSLQVLCEVLLLKQVLFECNSWQHLITQI